MHPNVHTRTIYNSQVMKQPKCSPTDEFIKKIWCMYTYTHTHTHTHTPGILLSHKKSKILPFATRWMDLEGINV